MSRVLGIYRKVSTVKSDQHLRRLIRSYCHQQTKVKATREPLAKPAHSTPDQGPDGKRTSLRPRVDFISSRTQTPILFGGFTAGMAGLNSPYCEVDVERHLERLANRWSAMRAGQIEKAKHLIFSISHDLQEVLCKGNMPLQDVLFAASLQALNRYMAWASGDASIGHLSGFHSDSDVGHMHMLVFPTDRKGRRLNLSPFSETKDKDGQVYRIDYQGFLHGAYEDGLRHYQKALEPRSLFPNNMVQLTVTNATLQAKMDAAAAKTRFLALGANAPKASPFALLVDALVEHRRDEASKIDLVALQAKERKEYHVLQTQILANPQLVEKFKADGREQMLILAKIAKAGAAEATKAAASMGDAVDNFAFSQNAYELFRMPLTGATVPFTPAVMQAVGGEIPKESSSHHAMAEQGRAQVARRKQEVKQANAAITSAQEIAGADTKKLHGVANVSLANVAFISAVKAAAAGHTPYFLAHGVAPKPSEPNLRDMDGGLARLKANVVLETEKQRELYRPFDREVDANRSFAPYRAPAAADDDGTPPEEMPPRANSPLYDTRPATKEEDLKIAEDILSRDPPTSGDSRSTPTALRL
jgi:hypothetical protein